MASTNTSPGLNTTETDLTNSVPSTGASSGAFVGQFSWGPCLQYVSVGSVDDIVTNFHTPTDINYVDWFSAASFMAYTAALTIIRVVDENAINATDSGTGLVVLNSANQQVVSTSQPTDQFVAKYPGLLGNTLAVEICDARHFSNWKYASLFDFAPATSASASAVGASNDEVHVVVVDTQGLFSGVPGSALETFAFLSKAADAVDSNNLPNYYVSVLNSRSAYLWAFAPVSGAAVSATTSGGDTVDSATVTAGGTGYVASTTSVSFGTPPAGGITATGTVTVAGGVVTGITITNPGQGYTSVPLVTIVGAGTGATATSVVSTIKTNAATAWGSKLLVAGVASAYSTLVTPLALSLSGGLDSTTVGAAEIITGLEMMQDSEQVNVGLLFLGQAGGSASWQAVAQYAINDVAEARQDLVVFFSPCLEDVLNQTQTAATAAVLTRLTSVNSSSSYAVMDSGWKLMYDVYNDKYRWIPLNADIAGLCARTDNTNNPWWSPAGFNRGALSNVTSLAYNPNLTSRNALYKLGVNPVVTFTDEGTVLYGDRTLQGKNSAFSQIGVRRLFITLRKTISSYAKGLLFEFNDTFTQNQFVSNVNPFMSQVKGQRGCSDYNVICDSTNNPPLVVQQKQFVGAIFVKPNYSINWITLNFVAVNQSVSFSEVAGATNA
jgi:hypothetical protein